MTTLSGNLAPGGFLSEEETALGERYLNDGHVIAPVEDRAALDRMRDHIAALAARYLGVTPPDNPQSFLNRIGEYVNAAKLNDLRLAVINGANAEPWFREFYYAIGRKLLSVIVGNELVMQRRVNLSIQLPDDDSSLLPVHADVWSGDSPYEVVMWLPLVDCFGTKAMYLMPPTKDAAIQSRFSSFNGKSSEDLYKAIEADVKFIDISYGQVIVFNHNLMHGNRINREAETRWSMNCRFKSLFSPYADKRLGEFFEPITIRPATRIGMSHKLPGGFEE
jgi:sporadic carbohydrate cluster 2OG-Fe(II) oxygenase